ncbi:MAG: DUF58 domain-containing protein [Thermodesulfobacteriota bacterium]
MLPRELYSKVQRFHFKTRYMSSGLFAGQYISAFKGKGMEFAEVREYQVGDDVRDIDWNVTARFGHPYVKLYSEERELMVILVVDLSASQLFGTRSRTKREVAAEVAGLLAFVAVRGNDKVGAVLFSGNDLRFVPPAKGPAHVWGLIKDMFAQKVSPGTSDLSSGLTYVNRIIRRRSIVFFISDFLTAEPDEKLATTIRLTARKHDLTCVKVADPAERVLPDAGLGYFSDPETGHVFAADLSSRDLQKKWQIMTRRNDQELSRIMNKSRVDLINVSTDGSTVEPLTAYFRKREARK